MKPNTMGNAVISGITIGIKSILACNHAIKAIDREAYNISINRRIKRGRL